MITLDTMFFMIEKIENGYIFPTYRYNVASFDIKAEKLNVSNRTWEYKKEDIDFTHLYALDDY